MACERCQASEAEVCEFVNQLLDDSPPLHPFELRLVGPNQLNLCVLAAIQHRLVEFPKLSKKAASKIKKKIKKRNGIIFLNQNMNIDDFTQTVRLILARIDSFMTKPWPFPKNTKQFKGFFDVLN